MIRLIFAMLILPLDYDYLLIRHVDARYDTLPRDFSR